MYFLKGACWEPSIAAFRVSLVIGSEYNQRGTFSPTPQRYTAHSADDSRSAPVNRPYLLLVDEELLATGQNKGLPASMFSAQSFGSWIPVRRMSVMAWKAHSQEHYHTAKPRVNWTFKSRYILRSGWRQAWWSQMRTFHVPCNTTESLQVSFAFEYVVWNVSVIVNQLPG